MQNELEKLTARLLHHTLVVTNTSALDATTLRRTASATASPTTDSEP